MLEDHLSQEISNAITRKKIRSVFHFTPIENLYSILAYGLLSRSRLREHKLSPVFVDLERRDALEDYLCISINSPNRFMLRAIRQRCPQTEFVMIKLCEELLQFKNCLFYPDNAALTELRDQPISNFSGLDAFKTFIAADNGRYGYGGEKLSQREILIKDSIETYYFKVVMFENEPSTKSFSKDLKQLKIPFNVGEDCFNTSVISNRRIQY